MRLIQNIRRDMKQVKAELIRLETKLERLIEEENEAIKEILEVE